MKCPQCSVKTRVVSNGRVFDRWLLEVDNKRMRECINSSCSVERFATAEVFVEFFVPRPYHFSCPENVKKAHQARRDARTKARKGAS